MTPVPARPWKGTLPRGRRRIPGTMNSLEALYAKHLEILKKCGEIAEFWFEGITLKLASDTRYTPDFLVMLPDGALELHETKGGFFRDDALIKTKVAAAMFPFPVLVIRMQPKKEGGGWLVKRM